MTSHCFLGSYSPLVGRVLLGALFFVSGVGMLMGYSGTVGFFTSLGLPMPEVMVVLAIVIKVVGGAMLALGYYAHHAAKALALFTVVATVVAHMDFPAEMTNFLKNVAILGGLVLVSHYGAGPYSLQGGAGKKGCGGNCSYGTCEACDAKRAQAGGGM